MTKKIVVLYATAGIGHKKAALAVKKALDEIAPKTIEVSCLDSLDYTNSFFKWSYLKSYLLMVNKLPTFWGLSYYLTDNFFVNLIVSKMRRVSNWLNSKKLRQYLIKTQPEVIISTHFFASEVVSDMKRSGILQSKLITVVTDYRLHSWWVASNADIYVVAGKEAKADLVKWGVSEDKIRIMGIPIEPIFSKTLDNANILKRLDLKAGLFTVLVIGGGFGVGPIEEIIKEAGMISADLQVIAICGHNKQLVDRLNALKPALKAHLKVMGFVDNVYEYMGISDILISKSGGITVSESLAKEIPLIIIAPILGQETRNAEFLLSNGAAFKMEKIRDLKSIIENAILDRTHIEKMKLAIRAVKKPRACYDVAELALKL